MTEVPPKKESSTAALKNANKHLSELFAAINRNSILIEKTISLAEDIKRGCGELKVDVWVESTKQTLTVKQCLDNIITNLKSGKIDA